MALVTVQRSPTASTTSSPCVSEAGSGEDDRQPHFRSISENFLTVKGAALFLPRGNGSSPPLAPRITQRRNTHTGDLQQHLQTMFTVLRPEDTIRLAVRLESAYPQCTRYMVVVSTNGRQDTEESVVLGMDFNGSDCSQCTVGLVLPLWSDTLIHLDGDGGFSVSTVNRVHIFKPVSVQAMWSALQSLHKACEVARCHNYFPGSLFLTWVSYYQTRISSEQHCINEWNAMRDVQSHRSDSPVLFTDVPTERERTERLIKTRLREIMMQKDLENVTSKEIRSELEMQMVCNLREFKEFIDNEMIVILGQMDSPTEIFEHVYLGSEWNASNLEELQSSGVRYILNVTREIDNFFPGLFEYHNIRVYDEEATNLLEYWNDTYKFISKAKKAGVKCLVHCKMGVSRSASTVIAYAMKEYGWDLDRAYDHVKERRSVTKPNPSFMKQLEEYQGILLASKQRHNKLWRSHSDSDLSEQQESANKSPRTLGRSDPHNHQHKPSGSRSIQSVLQTISSSQPDMEDTRSEMSLHSSTENDLHSERSQEDPLLSALPRPRAATVLPERNFAERASLKIAMIVPVTPPHPPSSPHDHVSPRPSTEQSLTVPEPKTDTVELSSNESAQNDTQSSAAHSLAVSLDTVSSFSETGDTLASSGNLMTVSPSEAPTEVGYRSSSGSDSCSTGETTQRMASSSNPSSDRIDFFSAREKFLSLSQDGQACLLYEVTEAPAVNSQSPTPCLEEPSPAAVEGSSPSESCSEAIESPSAEPQDGESEPDSVCSVQPPALSPQHQSTIEEQQENEKQDDLSLPESYSMPSCELASEQERQRESILSKSSDSSELQQSCFPPGGTTVSSCCDCVKAEEHGEETRPLDDDDSGIIPDPSLCTVTVNPSLDPSCSSSSSLLWLESEVEDTTARPHDLHKIQETLRELQAFLYEAGGMEACFNHSQLLHNVRRSTGSRPRSPALWQRAMEMEARIRQAGLTPPSLMKRSASLAKLDQLELSTHDLNDWDFRSELPSSLSSSSSLSSRSHSHSLSNRHDEAHKKQRVLPQNRTETCPLTSVCPKHSQRGGTGPPTYTSAPPTDSIYTRQQQHTKPHPVRRVRKSADKKKTVTVLYNTM